MSTFRKLQKGVTKAAMVGRMGGAAVGGAALDKLKEAKDGIKDTLTDSNREMERSNSGQFHESDDEDQDIRFSLAPGNGVKSSGRPVAGYSTRPAVGDDDPSGDTSDDDMYLDSVPESHEGEMGLNDDDDSTGAQVKKKKKVKKIRYRKAGAGDDSDGSDEKSAKSSKSSKSAKSRARKKKLKNSGAASVGSKKKKNREPSPTRQNSSVSMKSETSSVKRKKKKKPVYDSSDDDDEKADMLSPLASPKKVGGPVLPTRSGKSPGRKSPNRKKRVVAPPFTPTEEPSPNEHPIKQELQRFSDIWKSQAGDGESGDSIRVSKVLGGLHDGLNDLRAELNGEMKEDDPYENDILEAKLRSTEQKLLDSESKVEELIVKKNDIQKELDEEQLRNDELGRKLLYLEDKIEELEAEKQELEAHPKVVEQQADPIEIFELQQEVNQLKSDMSLKQDQHSEALYAKDERIKELEVQLAAAQAGTPQERESVTSLHSMHSTMSSGGDAKTHGLLLRNNLKIQEQETEIKELKQKLAELGNAEIIEQKDEEIKNLGVQMSDLETKMKEMEKEHQDALKQKEETIEFFQTQVVEMQKKMPKPAAYTRQKVGEEGTMTLGGDGGSDDEGGGLWGAISSASPGWLGGRQTVDRRKARGVSPTPNL